MRVILNDEYFVEVDRLNFILYKKDIIKKGNNKGLTTNRLMGYFQDMKRCLIRIIAEESRPETKETMEEFLARYNDIDRKLLTLVDNIIIEKKLKKHELVNYEDL